MRQVAALVGVDRKSVGRVLGQLERAGWARRERGDARAGLPDAWSAVARVREQWLARQRADSEASALAVTQGRSVGVCGRARMRAVSSFPPPARLGGLEAPRRLGPGELQRRVLDLLRSRPMQEFGPVELARMLGGRSPGAVMNACQRLVASGEVQCSCLAPLRYTASFAAR